MTPGFRCVKVIIEGSIDAFSLNDSTALGGHYREGNTIFMFNQSIEQYVASSILETAKTTILLHEIGHALGLCDFNPNESETALYCETIMDTIHYNDFTVIKNFTTELLQIIQILTQPSLMD